MHEGEEDISWQQLLCHLNILNTGFRPPTHNAKMGQKRDSLAIRKVGGDPQAGRTRPSGRRLSLPLSHYSEK